jgi:hypothetical protein
MTERTVTRRAALQGGAAFAGALVLGAGRDASWRSGQERPTLVVFWLNGGPAGLFNSAGSFLRSGAFGVTANNVRDLGNRLIVDAQSRALFRSRPRPHGLRELPARDPSAARAGPCGGAESSGRSQLLRLARPCPRRRSLRGCERPGPAVGVASDPPAEAGFVSSAYWTWGAGGADWRAGVGRHTRGLRRTGRSVRRARPTRRSPRSSCSSAPEQVSSSPSPRTRAGPTASSIRMKTTAACKHGRSWRRSRRPYRRSWSAYSRCGTPFFSTGGSPDFPAWPPTRPSGSYTVHIFAKGEQRGSRATSADGAPRA